MDGSLGGKLVDSGGVFGSIVSRTSRATFGRGVSTPLPGGELFAFLFPEGETTFAMDISSIILFGADETANFIGTSSFNFFGAGETTRTFGISFSAFFDAGKTSDGSEVSKVSSFFCFISGIDANISDSLLSSSIHISLSSVKRHASSIP